MPPLFGHQRRTALALQLFKLGADRGGDLDALRSFVTGMECGSFAQAALRLSRSTSAVSAQLKKLESQCGAALVTKQGRHLVLTAEGEKLMSYARRVWRSSSAFRLPR